MSDGTSGLSIIALIVALLALKGVVILIVAYFFFPLNSGGDDDDDDDDDGGDNDNNGNGKNNNVGTTAPAVDVPSTINLPEGITIGGTMTGQGIEGVTVGGTTGDGERPDITIGCVTESGVTLSGTIAGSENITPEAKINPCEVLESMISTLGKNDVQLADVLNDRGRQVFRKIMSFCNNDGQVLSNMNDTTQQKVASRINLPSDQTCASSRINLPQDFGQRPTSRINLPTRNNAPPVQTQRFTGRIDFDNLPDDF